MKKKQIKTYYEIASDPIESFECFHCKQKAISEYFELREEYTDMLDKYEGLEQEYKELKQQYDLLKKITELEKEGD